MCFNIFINLSVCVADFSTRLSVCVAEFYASSLSRLRWLGVGLSIAELRGRRRALGIVAQGRGVLRLILLFLLQKAEFFQTANAANDSTNAAPYELGKRFVGGPAKALPSG